MVTRSAATAVSVLARFRDWNLPGSTTTTGTFHGRNSCRSVALGRVLADRAMDVVLARSLGSPRRLPD
ncbi:hypothetical protein [Amycolatopsis kentuckyensis]|uniref:hypothetical protein n=1 Tax=Amycolatopsis kentuckyensis TaxID=218823 RepID=UPI00356A686C